ncbi:MAG: class I SAM-dependent methyltransferase [Methanosarcinales archaeon]
MIETKTSSKDQFSKRSKYYAKSSALSDKDNLKLIVDLSNVSKEDKVLDVATGTGFLAYEFAKTAKEVIGVDITKEMLVYAEKTKEEEKVENVTFKIADAESLPFRDNFFDIVSCRYSFHHFLNPLKSVEEMSRVCKPYGKIVLVDMISSEDEEKCKYHNEIETLRDPSHVKVYKESELREMLSKYNLQVINAKYWDIDFYFDVWMRMADPSDETYNKVKKMMLASIEEDKTGLKVRRKENQILFTYSTIILIAIKK